MHSEHEIILIGDRVLIDPDEDQNKTPSGLFLPPGVKEKEKVQGGFIVKTGPGFPIPHTDDIEDEPWEEGEDEPHYLPLQAQEGDYAIFLRKSAIEIELESKRYLIVSHSNILLLIRENYLE
ncbi:MAG: co-chaperone GroES [Candidatus Marinimicrobia bacterium]|jgi:co-chaperonin GroES (HSP10)|nr:co-chaperone GroES [Candidatus Neomarinimicrobiota bacterium]OQC47709.1 MAG: 10 kDa chaperonin [Candidatus Marinimicrobia bacterium ADurb.Bin030]MBP9005504.1 co-chaperone GroES [Candidatus Neomarinimicrobiota bacterium]HNZ36010.1 co-chaperone GroES family protein [Candidatus Neomarinimicrobiota bacterium]HOD37584.1 co-chaperone GroES family protein [Candidatus Neomarinimicrobiota bacterium]